MRSFYAAAAILATVTSALAADPVGVYNVQGTTPGGGGYTGSVTVQKSGDTYSVNWVIGSTRYTGTAIGNQDFIGISYQSDNQTGLALYGADGNNWKGIWTYQGGTTIGTELWTRQ